MLLRYTREDTQRYVEALLSQFEAVEVDALRRMDSPGGTLLQIDTLLKPAHYPRCARYVHHTQRPRAMPLVGNVAYTGWARDTSDGRLYSALRDDVIATAPSAQLLIGEFSFASLSADTATAATDHYATHPVYYYRGAGNRLIVASDLRLILIAPQVDVAVSEPACRYFLSHTLMVGENESPEGMTFFNGIKKLSPSGMLTVDRRTGDVAVSARADALVPENVDKIGRRDYVDAFKQTLDQCVGDRLASGASALLLSGGIDSSTVLGACLASNHPPPMSITMSFNDADLVMSQDDKLLEALFAQRDLPHRMLYADHLLRLPSEADRPVWVDGPDTCANPLIKEAYAYLVQQNTPPGLVMTGEGGDAILGESMHECIVDSIRAEHGIRAAHRYLTENCGHRPRSRAYYRHLLNSVCPALAYLDWRRGARAPDRLAAPPYLAPALSSIAREHAATPPRSPRFRFVGHHATHAMLFPRASYFDSLNTLCVHSHPFLDPRMIAFALSTPPHVHHDYQRLDRANPYAVSKRLARAAYRDQLPDFIHGKTHKTSYALMARRMFHNSAAALYRLTEKPMLLHRSGLVDQPSFRRHLLAYIVATEDPNADLGTHYHFIRGVADLEAWLRRFSRPRTQLAADLSIRPLCALL
ncbi:asparagine synthase-related protein [Trinickia acidisoli]|uniref:asparagine synthase-related protein n=1 Tax=Trinickia acidisoli TaxID=2767482 RepID=UPI001A8F7F44|nr:asparagine synthase-related protein [Trinickia acidisoli]